MHEIATLSLRVDSEGVLLGGERLKGLEKQADKTEKSANKLGNSSVKASSNLKRLGDVSGTVAQSIRKVANRSIMASAAITTLSAATTAMMVKSTMEATDELAKFADKIGITTEALASLQYAGELTGVSTEKLNMGLQRMTRRIAEAAQGSGEAVSALNELGLSAQRLNGMRPDEQFKAVAGAMGDISNRSDQVRLAFKLFDSEGTALLNTLDAGIDGIAAMQQEAQALGIAMSRIDAAKIEQANDAMYKYSQISRGFTQHLTAELAPIIQGIAEEFVRAANAAGGMGEVATEAVDAMVRAVGVMGNSFHGIKTIWTGVKVLMYQVALDSVETVRLVEQETKGVINAWRDFFGRELLTMNRSLTSSSINLRMELNDAKKALIDLASAELPSDQIEKYVHKVRELSQVQAEAKANSLMPATPEFSDISPAISGFDEKELDRIRQNYTTKEQLLLEQTLKEQELLRQAELDKQMSERESQELREASWQSYYDKVGKLADDSAKKQAEAQAMAGRQLLSMQVALAGNTIGVMKEAADEGSGLWMAAVVAQKGLMAAQAIMSANLAAAQTLSAMIIPGVPASVPAAVAMSEKMRMLGYANAAMIGAQGVAEIAGSRASGGQTIEGQAYRVAEHGVEMFVGQSGEHVFIAPENGSIAPAHKVSEILEKHTESQLASEISNTSTTNNQIVSDLIQRQAIETTTNTRTIDAAELITKEISSSASNSASNVYDSSVTDVLQRQTIETLTGSRAAGGQTLEGSLYRVGEHGNELFTGRSGQQIFIPPENGSITPAHKVNESMGGDKGLTVNVFNAPEGTTVEYNERDRRLDIDIAKSETMGEIAEDFQTGGALRTMLGV